MRSLLSQRSRSTFIAALLAVSLETGNCNEFQAIYESSWTKLLHDAATNSVAPGSRFDPRYEKEPLLRCRLCDS